MVVYTQYAVTTVNIPLMRLWPNPIKGKTTNLTLQAEKAGNVTLLIFSGLGRLLSLQTFQAQLGENTFNLQLPDLARGIYYVRLVFGSENFTERLIVLGNS